MILVVKQVASLIIKQWRGEITIEEQSQLEQWASLSPANRELLVQLTNDSTLRKELIDYYEAEAAKEDIWQKISAATSDDEITAVPLFVHPRPKYRYYYFIAAAVSVAVLMTIAWFGFWMGNKHKQSKTPVATTTVNDVMPGGNKAVLTLSDGRKIILDNAANGTLVQDGNVVVNKTKDGELKYSASSLATNHLPLAYNTLSTPVGGQFQLVLPDGSRVWLDAASTITYPTSFTANERLVSITGEAYFEVEKDAKRPFRVSVLPTEGSRGAVVEVLGTHFNVNAYESHETIQTTLVEGKVKVVNGEWSMVNGQSKKLSNTQSAILKPGQLAELSNSGEVKVKDDADVAAIIAWKNGDFLFHKVDIETLTKQIARWYGVEVSFPQGKPKYTISGKIKRDVPLSQVLRMMEDLEVKCVLKGKTLEVLN